MKLQRGKFVVKQMSDIKTDKDKIIDLDYMGKFEFEGNSIPISRMFIEYYKDEYEFIPIEIYNQNNERMYFYFNKTLLENKPEKYLYEIAKRIINKNYSMWEYINKNIDKTDFWWNINGDYFIFFGEEKIELIKYFIESCYKRDGEKSKIKQKLIKAGYKME